MIYGIFSKENQFSVGKTSGCEAIQATRSILLIIVYQFFAVREMKLCQKLEYLCEGCYVNKAHFKKFSQFQC